MNYIKGIVDHIKRKTEEGIIDRIKRKTEKGIVDYFDRGLAPCKSCGAMVLKEKAKCEDRIKTLAYFGGRGPVGYHFRPLTEKVIVTDYYCGYCWDKRNKKAPKREGKTCHICGKPIPANSRKQKYCSVKCAKEGQRRYAKKYYKNNKK